MLGNNNDDNIDKENIAPKTDARKANKQRKEQEEKICLAKAKWRNKAKKIERPEHLKAKKNKESIF